MLHTWKFAANGVWEEALSVDAQQPIDIAAVERWVTSNPQNIALEAIFAEGEMPATMFGIRITSLPKAEQAQRIRSILLKTNIIKTEANFNKVADEIFPEFDLFSGELEAINIGIVSQWYSFGPEVLWSLKDKNKLPIPFDELKQTSPKFFEPTRNPAAIEFWYTKPTDHWYKIYVSDLHADWYFINPAKYQSAIKQLAAFIANT